MFSSTSSVWNCSHIMAFQSPFQSMFCRMRTLLFKSFAIWVVHSVFVSVRTYQEHDFLNTSRFPFSAPLVWGKQASGTHRVMVKVTNRLRRQNTNGFKFYWRYLEKYLWGFIFKKIKIWSLYFLLSFDYTAWLKKSQQVWRSDKRPGIKRCSVFS